MEWNRRLLSLAITAPLFMSLAIVAVARGSAEVAFILALMSIAAALMLKDFRYYWTWRIEVTPTSIRDSGGFRARGNHAEIALDEVSKWRKTPLRGRGNFRFQIYRDEAVVISWNSNYFPRAATLEADLTARLGAPERGAGDHRSGPTQA